LGIQYAKTRYEGTASELNVIPLSDIHFGSPYVDAGLLDRLFDFINEHRDNTRILLMGDEIENANRHSVGAGVYEQSIIPQQQIDEFVELMRPYADLIDGIITSNHVERTYIQTGVNVTKLIADLLHIPYLGHRAVVNFAWNKRSYSAYIWHGSGGGSTIGSVDKRLRNMSTHVPDAEILAMGHFHRCYTFQDKCLRVDPYNHKLREETRTFICTGTLLKTGGYADVAGLDLVQTGVPIVKLSGKSAGEKSVRVEWLMG
jgi:hypothetical protein